MQYDLIYYRKRQAVETAAAAAAQDSRISAIHHELARRYDERIRSLGSQRDIPLHPVDAA